MSNDPPKKAPQRTVIAPMPRGGFPDPAAGHGAGQGGGAPQDPSSIWGVPAPGSGSGAPPAAPSGGFGGGGPGGAGGGGGFGPPPGQHGGGSRPQAQRTVIGGMPDPSSFGAPAPRGFEADQGAAEAWMGAKRAEEGFFPELGSGQQAPISAPKQKIPLEEALRARTTGHAAGTNPLTGAAAGLLVLFGRLRSQVVDMQAEPLMRHVTAEIDAYERNAIEAGADPQDAMVAKYALCGTADDIVQNLPGTDRHLWVQYAMVARFFGRRTSGVGFFQEVDKALQDPVRKYDLLELMLTCLQLGFEGQYRGAAGGDVELQRVRRQIYETLRRVRAREDDDIAPRWQGLTIAAKRHGARLPVWVAAAFVLAILTGTYILMRMLIADEAYATASELRTLHPRDGLVLVRTSTLPAVPQRAEVAVEAVEAGPPPQLERIRDGLGDQIEAGALQVDTRGNFIAIIANNLVLFDSGRADARPEFEPIATRIAEVLNREGGDIKIVGHTDSVPLSGRGRFRNNQELSVARAQSVRDMVVAKLDNPDRVEVVGMGEDEPIASNETAEGRAENRRVEILLRREETQSALRD